MLAVLGVGCGDKARSDAAPTVSTAPTTAPEAPPRPASPLSIVLESKGEIALSVLDQGVVVADQARARWATAGASGDLVDQPMPSGLPSGPGRVLRAGGRFPSSVWLSFEKLRDDGKADSHPLFRLQKGGFKALAEDWRPAIAAWSKNRILAASTSSGKLKIKVIEPSLPKPPDDLPSARLTDPACAKSLVVTDMAALRSGEVVVAGTCKADIAAGAGASAKRYVVIRWPAAEPTDGGAPGPSDAGSSDAGSRDGASDDAPSGPAGVVDVMPGVSSELTHTALYMPRASDIWVAAIVPDAKPIASRVFHFDGTTWGAEAVPVGVHVRGLAGTPDGVLWMVTDNAVWKRPVSAAWEQVAMPIEGAWEALDVRAGSEGEVWLRGHVRAASGARDVVMRSRPATKVLRWE